MTLELKITFEGDENLRQEAKQFKLELLANPDPRIKVLCVELNVLEDMK